MLNHRATNIFEHASRNKENERLGQTGDVMEFTDGFRFKQDAVVLFSFMNFDPNQQAANEPIFSFLFVKLVGMLIVNRSCCKFEYTIKI